MSVNLKDEHRFCRGIDELEKIALAGLERLGIGPSALHGGGVLSARQCNVRGAARIRLAAELLVDCTLPGSVGAAATAQRVLVRTLELVESTE